LDLHKYTVAPREEKSTHIFFYWILIAKTMATEALDFDSLVAKATDAATEKGSVHGLMFKCVDKHGEFPLPDYG
jgi:hypothetical protein